MVKKLKKAVKSVKKLIKRKAVSKKPFKKKKLLKPTAKGSAGRLVLSKFKANPIIFPRRHQGWESWQTFNPGVVQLDNKVHFLYRAIGDDGMSRLGYAASHDGFNINDRPVDPVYEHSVQQRVFTALSYLSGGSWGGAEDPRVVRVDNEDRLYMTYTACNGDLRVGLTSIKLDDFLNKKWNWKAPVSISPPDQLHKNWLIFPEKINGKYTILLSVAPETEVAYLDSLDFDGTSFVKSCRGFGPQKSNSGKGCWDKWIRGAGPVPIKTNHGWLVFYHAMDNDWSKYKVGAMLLDLNDPTKVIARAKAPVLSPSEHYENNGFKGGVVYASGAVVKEGELMLYYGGADSYVCVAHANFEKFVESLVNHEEPKLVSRKTKV